ncbi:4-hydroxyphenylacetate 3-monooxygenase reductase subunit [Amycolatopsis rhizosphaerae]|uniref:4-hydroxyphenylacetate 3-monooxygenase reductase subunit n=1 Tax=Amycolatopsis rhizosphaerae TaxID=2053003 RepID=A0A558CAY4_9PSEU|nr:flavin reductase [Amycolatopsis rhizosphaerae]TVT45948.1 4-hydroxyphenylacetate 3-monooxygenase reductase subunit [Amycolatopsis rhizosphaerae]
MPEPPRKQAEFRAAMANLSAAVNVVTTDGPHGRAGMTVSAACSVTDSPPTVLVCVNRASRSHDILVGNGKLALNVLGAGHEDLARHFAGATKVPTAERFTDGRWDLATHGVPVLSGACASVVGTIVAEQVSGSHSVLFVEIDTVITSDDPGALVYFRRRFHSVGATTTAA